MAVQGDTIQLPAGVWVLISESGVAHDTATWQNKGHSTATLMAMPTETPPTSFAGSVDYTPGFGESNKLLSELWPNITPAYLYAMAQTGNSSMTCNHAA